MQRMKVRCGEGMADGVAGRSVMGGNDTLRMRRIRAKCDMTSVVTPKTEIMVPKSVRRKAGIKVGDQVEFIVSGRVINIVPKLAYANDAFTPEEEALIATARKEMREGESVTLDQIEHDLARKRPSRRRKTA